MTRRPNAQPTRRRPLRLNRSLFFSLIVLVLFVGSAKLSGPLGRLRDQQQALARLNLKRVAFRRDNTRLQRLHQHLATEVGQEQAAREKGYLRPGDRRLIFAHQDRQRPRRPTDGEDAAQEPSPLD